MTEEKVKLITGSLLHDIGKVIYDREQTGEITVLPAVII